MDLIATQPVEGVKARQKFTTNKDRGEWLLANGYAVQADGTSGDFAGVEGVPAKQDPTLARNREQAGETPPGVDEERPTGEPAGVSPAPEETQEGKKARKK